MPRARSRLSTLSMRSLAKRVMAKERAVSMSRLVRSWRLRKSATLRRYLSLKNKPVSQMISQGVKLGSPRTTVRFLDRIKAWLSERMYTLRSMISRLLASSSFVAGFSLAFPGFVFPGGGGSESALPVLLVSVAVE